MAVIEKKVKASAIGSYLAGVGGLEILETVHDNPLLISPLPDWCEPFILSLVLAAATFVSGWTPRHTPRTDPDARQAADTASL